MQETENTIDCFLDESFYTRMYTVYMIMWRAYGKNGRDCDRA